MTVSFKPIWDANTNSYTSLLPKFNKDSKFWSPAFIVPTDKVYILPLRKAQVNGRGNFRTEWRISWSNHIRLAALQSFHKRTEPHNAEFVDASLLITCRTSEAPLTVNKWETPWDRSISANWLVSIAVLTNCNVGKARKPNHSDFSIFAHKHI